MTDAADLLDDLEARGLLQDSTDRDALAARLAEGPITLYCGFDPTADSLHVGNLLGLLALRRFQDARPPPIALAGGATGMIGDPCGRSDERNLLDDGTLAANVAASSEQIGRLLGPDGRRRARRQRHVDRSRSAARVPARRGQALHRQPDGRARSPCRRRIAGRHGHLVHRVQLHAPPGQRLLVLHEHEGCELQVGGSDQWGNITAGIDLVRRRTRPARARPHLAPAASGRRHEVRQDRRRRESGSTPDRTSPYQFFQYWMHVDDADVERLLLQLTLAARRRGRRRRRARRGAGAARRPAPLGPGGHRPGPRCRAARAAEAASSVLFGGVRGAAAAGRGRAGEVPTARVDRRRLDAG